MSTIVKTAVRPVAASVTLAATILFGASGCSFAEAPPAVTVVVTTTATPTPTPTPPPAADVAPIAVEPPPAPPAEIVPNDPAPEVVEGPAYELGARPGAQGATTDDGSGNLLTYEVAEGDSFFDIAQRFDLPQQQLLSMNPSVHGVGLDIYIGDIINLDWTTTR